MIQKCAWFGDDDVRAYHTACFVQTVSRVQMDMQLPRHVIVA